MGDIEFDCANRHPGARLAVAIVDEQVRERLVSVVAFSRVMPNRQLRTAVSNQWQRSNATSTSSRSSVMVWQDGSRY
jgi:hypothetical protein